MKGKKAAPKVVESDLLAEVDQAARNAMLNKAIRDYMSRTDEPFFTAVETLGDFGGDTAEFARICDRLTRDAREVRACLSSLLRGV